MNHGLFALAVLGSVALASPVAASDTIRININKLAFSPAEVSGHVGDTIEWTNSDYVDHTATARKGDWDIALPAKGTGRVTLRKAGEIDYFCRFHPNMTGRIIIAPN